MRNLIIGRTLPAAALFALLWASAAAAVPTFTVNDTSDLVDDDVAEAQDPDLLESVHP